MKLCNDYLRGSFIFKAWLIGVIGLIIGCDGKVLVESPDNTLNPEPVLEFNAGSVPQQGDPRQEEQWATSVLGLDTVWENYEGTKLIRVAVLSTGIDYNHPDLNNNVFRNFKELEAKLPGEVNHLDKKDNDGNGYADDLIGWNVIEQNGFPFDKIGLGTQAAGIIGAVHDNGVGIKGVLKNVTMVPVKYIGEDGRITVPNIVEGIDYALSVNSDVIFLHMSNILLGSSDDINTEDKAAAAEAFKGEKASLQAALDKVKKNNAVLVVSAGNMASKMDAGKDSFRIMNIFAENKENVVIVTSVDKNNRRPRLANYGPDVVDIMAPGVDVLTTDLRNEYSQVSSTFAAAAYVAGAISLAIAEFSNRLPRKEIVKSLIQDDASTPFNLRDNEYYETVGRNQLHVGNLLSYLSKEKNKE